MNAGSGQPSTSSGQRRSLRDQSRSPRGQPSTSREDPSTSRDQPSTSREDPSTSRDQPSTSRDQPSTSSGQRRSLRDQSRSPRGQSSTSRDQPSTSRDQPSTSRDQSSTSIEEEENKQLKDIYIVRTVHFHHYLRELRNRKMIPNTYTKYNGRHEGQNGLLFRVKNESATSNLYGNYTYTISCKALANKFIGGNKYKVYCKDPVGNVSSNRRLIANPLKTAIIQGYHPYDEDIGGGPWYLEGDRNMFLEYFIVFSVDDVEELRLISTEGECDHNEANTQACFQYKKRNQGYSVWCPSPWTSSTAKNMKAKLILVSQQKYENAEVFKMLRTLPRILEIVRLRRNRFQPNSLERDLLNELQKVRNKSSRLEDDMRMQDDIMETMKLCINDGMAKIRRDLGIEETRDLGIEETTRKLTPEEIENVMHIVEKWMEMMLTRM